MPVTTTTNRTAYNCDSSQTAFPFTFPIFETSDLKVYLRDADGNETLLTETTHYVVSAANNDYSNGGTVTTVSTYDSTYDLVIIREVTLTQDTDYVENDAFPAETLEDLVDKAIMACQQLDEKLNRALLGAITDDSALDMTLPASSARAGKYLKFDDDGEPMAVTVVTPGTVTITSFAETILDDTSAAGVRATLGIETLDDLPDGSTYERILGSGVTSGIVSKIASACALTSAVTRYCSVPLCLEGSSPAYGTGNTLGGDGSGSVVLYLGVNLPHGAVVTSLKVNGIPNSGVSVIVFLNRAAYDGTSSQVLATCTITSGDHEDIDNTISYATVDNQSYKYWVTVTPVAPTGLFVLYGIIIAYTVSVPLP